jgi:hypothetical protein
VDYARKVAYTWIKNSTYPTGSWTNNQAVTTTYINASAGQTPLITPGASNLGIYALFTNTGNVPVAYTFSIKDQNGVVLTSATYTAQPGEVFSLGGYTPSNFAINMPSTPYSIAIAITP